MAERTSATLFWFFFLNKNKIRAELVHQHKFTNDDYIQYVDLMLALAEGAARKEGLEEGRKQGAVVGTVSAFLSVMIFRFSFRVPST